MTAIRTSRAMLIAAAMCAPLPLSALSIVISACDVDPATGVVYFAGSGPANSEVVNYSPVGDGVVSWNYVTPGGADASVIQSCSSGRELWVSFPTSGPSTVVGIFDQMVYGETPYTYNQISQTMRGLGAQTRRTRNTFGTCVCQNVGF